MIRRIIRISAVMRAGRGREIRDLVVKGCCGEGEMHFGKQCERCSSSIIRVLYEVLRSESRELLVSIFVNRLLTAKYQFNKMQKAEPGWLE